jgi:MFS family permease
LHADYVIELVFSAVSFGGTFLSITALIFNVGGSSELDVKERAAAVLTASFSVGQMLRPVIAGWLADQPNG